MIGKRIGIMVLGGVLILLAAACSSNNCPLENTVLCNYHFYDSEGTSITYSDAITIKTLLPGTKTTYTYRKLGYQTVVKERRDSTLIEQGYNESVANVRRDTILVNKSSSRSEVSVPMSYLNPADTLIFQYESISRGDTLIVSHKSHAHVELPECGAHYYHTLTGIKSTDAAIDHVEIVNSEVNYQGLENVKIYFNGVAEE